MAPAGVRRTRNVRHYPSAGSPTGRTVPAHINLRMAANSIDGIELPIHSPESQGELAALVRDHAARGDGIYPVGGATGLDYGSLPTQPGIAVSTAKLSRVVDYPARDMTITVEAGLTLAELDRTLAKEGQCLPVDAPDRDLATVGGALAVDVCGPRRLGRGTWRDWVIGMTFANSGGELCKAGGRVVKNVAGYDLPKLMIGTMGGLSVITQVTFKLQPKPAASAWSTVTVDDPASALDALSVSKTRPTGVDLVNAHAAGSIRLPSKWTLLILYEEQPEAVKWQVEQLRHELKGVEKQPDDWLPALTRSPAVAGCDFSILVGIRPSAVAEFVNSLKHPEARIHLHGLSGIARVGLARAERQDALELWRSVDQIIARTGGHAVVRRCPTEWKRELPVWGRPASAVDVVRRIKREFDAKGVLNPGRTSYG